MIHEIIVTPVFLIIIKTDRVLVWCGGVLFRCVLSCRQRHEDFVISIIGRILGLKFGPIWTFVAFFSQVTWRLRNTWLNCPLSNHIPPRMPFLYPRWLLTAHVHIGSLPANHGSLHGPHPWFFWKHGTCLGYNQFKIMNANTFLLECFN